MFADAMAFCWVFSEAKDDAKDTSLGLELLV